MPEITAKTYLDGYMRQHGVTSIAIAELCVTTRQAVQLWRQGKREMGVQYAKKISQTYGIALHLLRPDVWDDPAAAPAEEPDEIRAADPPLTRAARDGGGRVRKGPVPVPDSAAANVA